MKTRVKLYTHRIKSAANGQLYDVFEVRAPYTTTSPRSIRQQQQQQQQNQKVTAATSTTTTTTGTADVAPTDAVITKAFDITSTKQAYAPSYKEACMFLRAIQINRRERLSPQCLRHLATYVVQAWEVDPTETKVTELIDVMKHLLDTTRMIDTTVPLDDALRQSCRNPAALPTVCPTVALLVAMRYIDRLKKKYNNIRGAMGCSHRLVVVAYMMAIKYIHANLRLIVDVTTGNDEQQQQQQQQQQAPATTTATTTEERRRSSVDSLLFSRLSTERSTLRKSPSPAATATMVSPPASPKSCSSSPEQQKKQLPSLQEHLQQQDSQSQRALRALRMEIEFLHFLNYDLTLSDPVGLVEWAHRRPPTTSTSERPVEPSATAGTATAAATTTTSTPYDAPSSADEGDDEMESDDDDNNNTTPSVGY